MCICKPLLRRIWRWAQHLGEVAVEQRVAKLPHVARVALAQFLAYTTHSQLEPVLNVCWASEDKGRGTEKGIKDEGKGKGQRERDKQKGKVPFDMALELIAAQS